MQRHDTPIPEGFCQCGCGQRTQRARADRGPYRKGDWQLCVKGHKPRLDPVQRLLDKRTPPNERGCRLYTGSTFDNGYGQFWLDGRNRRAHQVVLEWKLGRPLAPGMTACHECDVRLCCTEEHLFEGTIQENLRDRDHKGRQARGERHGVAKLTEVDVLQMRKLYEFGMSISDIHRRYANVASRTTTDYAVRRLTWKHI